MVRGLRSWQKEICTHCLLSRVRTLDIRNVSIKTEFNTMAVRARPRSC